MILKKRSEYVVFKRRKNKNDPREIYFVNRCGVTWVPTAEDRFGGTLMFRPGLQNKRTGKVDLPNKILNFAKHLYKGFTIFLLSKGKHMVTGRLWPGDSFQRRSVENSRSKSQEAKLQR